MADDSSALAVVAVGFSVFALVVVVAVAVRVGRLLRTFDGGLRHMAVVRYDAFADTGGTLSFSVALLDDAGDGLVLTSISGRTGTRTYAKGVHGGTSGHVLSPEEQEAVAKAIRTGGSRRMSR